MSDATVVGDDEQSRGPVRQWLLMIVSLVITVGFAALAVRGLDWSAVGEAWSRTSTVWLLAGLSCLAISFAIRIWRWWWMLRRLGGTCSVADCATPFLGSIAFNNILPLRAGDVIRVVAFRRQLATDEGAVLASVVVERVADVCVLIGFLVVGSFTITVATLPPMILSAIQIGLVALVVILLAVLICPRPGVRLCRAIEEMGERRGWAWLALLGRVGRGAFEAVQVLRHPLTAVQLLLISVATWLWEAAAFACVASGVGLGISLWSALFINGGGTMATMLPAAPGHVGTFDYATTLCAQAAGAEREPALLFALLIHLLLWLPVTVVGLIMVGRNRMRGPSA